MRKNIIVFGGGMGDVIKRSATAWLFRSYLFDHEVHYLSPYDLPIPGTEYRHIFNYSRAKTNPFYYFSLVNEMRAIGFKKVAIFLPFWEGFLSFLGTDIGAETVYCDVTPPNEFFRFMSPLNMFLHRGAVKRSVKLIPVENGWDEGWNKKYFPSDVWRHLSLISKVIKDIKPNLKMENRFLLPASSPPRTGLDLPRDVESNYLAAIHDAYSLETKNIASSV